MLFIHRSLWFISYVAALYVLPRFLAPCVLLGGRIALGVRLGKRELLVYACALALGLVAKSADALGALHAPLLVWPLLWMRPVRAATAYAVAACVAAYFAPPWLAVLVVLLDAATWARRDGDAAQRRAAHGTPIERGRRAHIEQDPYRRSKVPDDLDLVVIGSGMGGLICANVAARLGKRVLVLEQHYRSGGATHTFDEVGDNLFDSGIHYVGGMKKISALLDPLTDERVEFAPMGAAADGYLYDEFDVGIDAAADDEQRPVRGLIRYRATREAVVRELVEKFGARYEAALRRYFAAADALTQRVGAALVAQRLASALLPRVLAAPLERVLGALVRRWGGVTADAFVARFVRPDECKQLHTLLASGQLIDWNEPPATVSAFVSCAMLQYYESGAVYPVGGSHVIAQRIIPAIERAGGRVLCGARVDRIVLTADGVTALGVRLDNGDEIRARAVVSDAGSENTHRWLLRDARMPPTAPSNGHISAFISLDGDAAELGLRPSNLHSMALDVNAAEQRLFEAPLDAAAMDACVMVITAPSAKDPAYAEQYPGRSNVLMLAEAKWSWVQDMARDSDEYKRFKLAWRDAFLRRLFKYYPHLKTRVTHVEIGTPLTTKKYLGKPSGESYGIAWTPAHFDAALEPYVRIDPPHVKRLYLTGEDTIFGGFVGAIITGWATAFHLFGVDVIDLLG